MKYSEFFELTKNPRTLISMCVLKSDAPKELHQLIEAIHSNCFDGAMPHDWIYETIRDAFETLEEDDFDNVSIEADTYYHQLHDWLAVPGAQRYCDEATEMGKFKGIYEIIAAGQAHARWTVYSEVNQFLDLYTNKTDLL